jgi:nucleotide-binding universal stress UspA family protein
LLWIPTSELTVEIRFYVQALADRLHADLRPIHIPWHGEKSINRLIAEVEKFNPNLIIFQIPDKPQIPQLLMDFTINKLIEQTPASILVFKEPRMLLDKLLLVIRDGNETSESALDWTIQLARHNQTSVTIMSLLPPVPEMYGPAIHHSLSALLTANDPLGKKMRWIARRLSGENIKGTFKLRNDTPLEQLHGELSESDVDLVVIAAEPKNHIWRWLFGEVVNDLFDWFDRPLLITKPITH